MKNKKGINFFLLIMAIIIGCKVYEHFDFQAKTFKKPALDMVYLGSFLLIVIVLIADLVKKPKK